MNDSQKHWKDVKQEFGHLVKNYRNIGVKKITQHNLEVLSNIPARTIHDIENAKKAVLDYETVEKLASAFQLKNHDREDFFRTAGINTPPSNDIKYEWKRAIFDFYKSQELPALVTTPLGDVHSINSYALALLNIDPYADFFALTAPASPHILQFLFDPAFNAKKLYRGSWQEYAQLLVWLFRYISSTYGYENRYHQLMSEMQKFNDFMKVWETMDTYELPNPPYSVTIFNEQFGEAHFTIAQTLLPSSTLERVLLVFYLPDDEQSAKTFARIRSEVAKMAFQLDNHNGYYFSRIY